MSNLTIVLINCIFRITVPWRPTRTRRTERRNPTHLEMHVITVRLLLMPTKTIQTTMAWVMRVIQI